MRSGLSRAHDGQPEHHREAERRSVDGQRITVTVTGFGVGGRYGCRRFGGRREPVQGCGLQPAEQVLIVTNERRTGSATFIVHERANTQPNPSHMAPCAGTCVIVA